MQHILLEQILSNISDWRRFSVILLVCIANLTDGIWQFNQQQVSLIVLDLSLILSGMGQEELLRSFRPAHGSTALVHDDSSRPPPFKIEYIRRMVLM